MRNLQEYANFAMELLDELHIPYTIPENFTVNSRARRWGLCKLNSGKFYISVNQTLLDERNSEDGLINTLLHELLHTCPGCLNHGAIWKKYAAMVYGKFGYNVKRTNDEQEKGVTTGNFNATEREYKYLIYCEKCHKLVAKRKKRCGVTENPGKWQHVGCGGHLYMMDISERCVDDS